jgi:hypothetical protein
MFNIINLSLPLSPNLQQPLGIGFGLKRRGIERLEKEEQKQSPPRLATLRRLIPRGLTKS